MESRTVPATVIALDTLMTVEEVAALLRIPTGTLYQWRSRRTGPKSLKVGRYLRYEPADIRAWLEECGRAGR